MSQFIIIWHYVDLGYFDLLKAAKNLTVYIQFHFKNTSIPIGFLERGLFLNVF